MKNVCKLIGALAVLVGVVSYGKAVCAPTDIFCYQTGSTPTQVLKADSSGALTGSAVTLTGNQTTAGKTIFTPSSQVTVSTQVPINPTATYMQVISTGGTVVFGLTSSYPAIATATAASGQYLVLSSTSSSSIISISTGNATAVFGTDPFVVISSTKSAVAFIYDATLSVWREINRQ